MQGAFWGVANINFNTIMNINIVWSSTRACWGHSCVLVQPGVLRFIAGTDADDQPAQHEQYGKAELLHCRVQVPLTVYDLKNTCVQMQRYVIVML